MAIITISRGSFTRGKEVADKVAQKLGYDCISREVLLQASDVFNIPEIKLTQAIEDAPSFLDRFTHGREKYIAYIQSALFDQIKKDNMIYHGFACHFFVKDIPNVLKVRINSNLEDRIKIGMERDHLSRKQALRLIKKVDEQRKRWGRKLYGFDPWDSSLYDLVLNIDRITVNDAVSTIYRIAQLEPFRITPEVKKSLENLALAAEVRTHLIGVKPDVEICADNGYVTLNTGIPVSHDSELVQKIGSMMKTISEIKGIKIMTDKTHMDSKVCLPEIGNMSPKDAGNTYIPDF